MIKYIWKTVLILYTIGTTFKETCFPSALITRAFNIYYFTPTEDDTSSHGPDVPYGRYRANFTSIAWEESNYYKSFDPVKYVKY